jgi:hypothetical protein
MALIHKLHVELLSSTTIINKELNYRIYDNSIYYNLLVQEWSHSLIEYVPSLNKEITSLWTVYELKTTKMGNYERLKLDRLKRISEPTSKWIIVTKGFETLSG